MIVFVYPTSVELWGTRGRTVRSRIQTADRHGPSCVFGDVISNLLKLLGFINGLESWIVWLNLQQFLANAFVFVENFLKLLVHVVMVKRFKMLRFRSELILWIIIDDLYLVQQYLILLIDFDQLVWVKGLVPLLDISSLGFVYTNSGCSGSRIWMIAFILCTFDRCFS